MKILTTNDLSYVSGGDSWGGTPEGQAPTSYDSNWGCSDSLSRSEYAVAAAAMAAGSQWWGSRVGAAYAAYCAITFSGH